MKLLLCSNFCFGMSLISQNRRPLLDDMHEAFSNLSFFMEFAMEGKNAFGEMPTASAHVEEHQEAGIEMSLEQAKDYFIEKDGEKFAGLHLIIDCLGARNLSSLEAVETCLRSCIEAAGATLLHIHLHHFTPEGGISGVAVLAESHISIHLHFTFYVVLLYYLLLFC